MSSYDEEVFPPVYRESSSLIICAKSLEKLSNCDYRILMLKRSDNTAISKNQAVFPGGILDPSDESIEWLQYFEEFGVSQQSLRDLVVLESQTDRPKIFAAQGAGCYDRFFKKSKIWAREISLRINALRETFEEVGIFLCRSRDQLNSYSRGSFCNLKLDRKKWQGKVHENAKEFINMCREHEVVPDLWSLYEWSSWTSPAIVKKGYETAFFITFLNEIPELLCELTEVKEYLWLPAASLIQLMRESELFLLPPQFYELMRINSFKSFALLQNFVRECQKKGVTMYRPIPCFCTDGVVCVLPGDDFYKDDSTVLTVSHQMNCTKAEFRTASKYLNRIENPGTPYAILYANIKPFNEHMMPLQAVGPYKL